MLLNSARPGAPRAEIAPESRHDTASPGAGENDCFYGDMT